MPVSTDKDLTWLTQEEVKRWLSYNPETGEFIWLKGRQKNMRQCEAKKISAGTINDQGYRIIKIKGRRFRASRLAVLYMTGNLPEDVVDHVNNNRADNRWENLQCVSHKENCQNQDRHYKNDIGVHYREDCGQQPWSVQLRAQDGADKRLGHFTNKEDAIKAALIFRTQRGY